MLKKRKGFTLIELLAVIVILGIILAIAIPTISEIINTSTINAFEKDGKMILKAVINKMAENSQIIETGINKDTIGNLLKISTDNYESLVVSSDENGNPYITIVGKNKWSGLISCGIYNDINVVEFLENCPGFVPSWPDTEGNIYTAGQHEDMWTSGYVSSSNASINMTFNPDDLDMRLYMPAGGIGDVACVTSEPIDLTDVDSINILFDYLETGEWFYARRSLIASPVQMGTVDDYAAYAEQTGVLGNEVQTIQMTLDVQHLNGEHYIRFHLGGSLAYPELYINAYIKRVWIE